MEKGWIQVASYAMVAVAELKKSILESAGIPVILINKSDSSYLFGDLELYVKHDDVIRSKMILDEEVA